MNKTIKVIAISVVAALFFALPLAAQTYDASPAGEPTSNQRNATATLYKTDVDNFLNVNNWSAVNLDGWFAFLHGSAPNGFRGNIGYATKVSDLYLGFRYYGNIFQNTGGNETVTLNPTYNQDTQQLTSLTETTAYPNRWHNSTNQFEVLIGVAGMGIKVGFYESFAARPSDQYSPTDAVSGNTMRDLVKTDNQNGYIDYSGVPIEYSRLYGLMQPSIQWGTLLNISGLTVKPRVGFALNIFQNTLIDNYYAPYTEFNGTPTQPKNEIRGNGNNSGYLQPVISAGADITLPKKDNLGTTFTLNYAVNFNAYDNDYSASGFSGTAAGPVSWSQASTTTTTSINGDSKTTTASLSFNDTVSSTHSITPIITLDKTVIDGLNLGLAIRAPITITSGSTDTYSETRTISEVRDFTATNSADAKTVTETTVYNPNGLTETSRFNIASSVRIGAKYNLIPKRFTVNAGVQLDPCSWTYSTSTRSRNGTGQRKTETVKDGDGVVTSRTDITEFEGFSDVSSATSTWSPLSGAVAGGFVFSFNDNIALDFMANAGWTNNDSYTAQNWSLNLTTVNVMFTFKFDSKAKSGGDTAAVQSRNVAAQEANVDENNY
jgi:hypothetical protein